MYFSDLFLISKRWYKYKCTVHVDQLYQEDHNTLDIISTWKELRGDISYIEIPLVDVLLLDSDIYLRLQPPFIKSRIACKP